MSSTNPPKGLEIRFPPKPPAGPTLTIPRRRPIATARPPVELLDASAEAKRSINAIVSATRPPFGGPALLSDTQVSELEKALRILEAKLDERTRFAEDLEIKHAERMRDMAELEALLAAREKVIDAAKKSTASNRPGATISAEEKTALEALRTELDRQEASLKEQRTALAERESFVEENELKLFEKMQQQQERETEMDQKQEELNERERRIQARETGVDPATVAPKPAAPPKTFDEFNE